jgi:DNA-directed RNA polymerase subunit omega
LQGKGVETRCARDSVKWNFTANRSFAAFLLPIPLYRSFCTVSPINSTGETTLRDDYLHQAQEIITDPMILINVVSRRAKQLKSGYKPLIESLERLSAEDMALREIIEGKITYQLDELEEA